jgi:outer membrane protein assembly factor BamB
VSVGDRLYVHATDDRLKAVDATTGRVRWSGGEVPRTFSPPPAVAADGTVIVGSDARPVVVGVRCGEQRGGSNPRR